MNVFGEQKKAGVGRGEQGQMKLEGGQTTGGLSSHQV